MKRPRSINQWPRQLERRCCWVESARRFAHAPNLSMLAGLSQRVGSRTHGIRNCLLAPPASLIPHVLSSLFLPPYSLLSDHLQHLSEVRSGKGAVFRINETADSDTTCYSASVCVKTAQIDAQPCQITTPQRISFSHMILY